MNIGQIIKLNEKITEQLIVLRNESLDYIKRTLGEDGVAVFDNGAETLTITYDGGNHPEYAAYPYAVVTAFTRKVGTYTSALKKMTVTTLTTSASINRFSI